MTCDLCTDPDGKPCYPQYGLAPHIHLGNSKTRVIITHFEPKESWPSNFEADPDDETHGTWWCVNCGKSEGSNDKLMGCPIKKG